ncbi:MAG: N-acetylmuramoyl-L-alanine amidase, partial [Clostridium sp.]|uniref:N-acetylmuramoyl-L-alanine amidase n=1 Tax=Clostridium sp. TaxID=1506 RepID=UPI0039958B99
SNGAKTLKVVITSNDGSTQTLTKSINIKRVTLQSRSNLDDPYGTADITSNTLLIRGWALSGSGVKSVEAFIDGASYGQIKYGVSRTDVNKVYPGYSSGDNCGFEGRIDISKLSNGAKTLKVVITSNDGSTQTLTKSIVIKDLIYNLEDPNDNYLYAPNGKLLVKGWALSKTGIKEISVSIDGKYYGTVDYGKIRPDVTKFYPNYINSGNSGFEKTFDLSDLTDGDKIITITVVSNNGSKSTITKTVKKVTLNSVCWLDDPIVDKQITDGKLVVNGWALNVSGTKEIRVKVDGNLVGKATLNVTRTDVYNVYPEYGNKNSGYTGTFNISSLSSGNKKLLVEIEYNDGTVQVITRNFKLGKQKTVYIDAGHDYGGDMGAVRVINGVTYDETTLNIEVAEYLRTELINKGYEVIMARRIGERPTSNNYRENLWNRINAANNANADFYISIHQNASTTTSANGVEAYYCSVKPDSLNDITYKLNTSKAVAASISSGIASALSMTNRGAKDDEFMVVKYTNMPAVLVECGFISNESDAKKISNATNQKKIASVIADSIHNALK